MEITLTALHWIYMIGVIFVITAMAMRKDVVVPCLVFTVLSGLVASGGNLAEALLTEARALLFSFSEFQSLILGIGIMVMMSKQMADMGTDRTLIEPVAKIVKPQRVLLRSGYCDGRYHCAGVALPRYRPGGRSAYPHRPAGRNACYLGCGGHEYVRSRLYDVL